MYLRQFNKLDQPSINKLQEEFMVEFFPEYADDPLQYEWNADIYDINECYINKGGKIWVAEVESHIVGFGGFRMADPKTAEIKRVRINSLHRGKGIGKLIVKQIENYCRSATIEKILVDTDARFEAAKAMYTNMGYVLYRTKTKTDHGIEYTDNFYEKSL
jgi:GNAT superfamily N-acetyltransferase